MHDRYTKYFERIYVYSIISYLILSSDTAYRIRCDILPIVNDYLCFTCHHMSHSRVLAD